MLPATPKPVSLVASRATMTLRLAYLVLPPGSAAPGQGNLLVLGHAPLVTMKDILDGRVVRLHG